VPRAQDSVFPVLELCIALFQKARSEPTTLDEVRIKTDIMSELFAELEWCLCRGGVANVRLPNEKGGASCLHLGVASGSMLLAQLLISGGALLDAKDSLGRTPLHWALSMKDCPSAIIRLLCKTDHKLMLIPATNKDAPLHLMAMRGDFPIMNYSMSFFSKEEISKFIDIPGRGGRTALHYACRRGLIEIMGALIHFGANPWATCDEGLTSLHHVVASSDCSPRKEITLALKMILQCCPKMKNIRDRQGRTPADIAKLFGNYTAEVSTLLL